MTASFPSPRPLRAARYRLTTAEILYRMPDHPALLQTYLWQEMDMPPQFPQLKEFLSFWKRELEGELHSVRIASAGDPRPGKARHADMMATLH